MADDGAASSVYMTLLTYIKHMESSILVQAELTYGFYFSLLLQGGLNGGLIGSAPVWSAVSLSPPPSSNYNIPGMFLLYNTCLAFIYFSFVINYRAC
jgi:hypothetical protein